MKKRTQIILWILCITWIIVLVFFSSESGSSTQRRSRELAKVMVAVFQMAQTMVPQVDRFLRSFAHFAGFFVLGSLVYAAVRGTFTRLRHPSLLCMILCSGIGVVDEIKKLPIPGRHLDWPDAGLNVLGVCFGVVLMTLIVRCAEYYKSTRFKESCHSEH